MKIANFGSLTMTCALALASGALTPAHAGRINVSAATCVARGASQSALNHTLLGVSTNVNVNDPVDVVCSVPRASVTNGQPSSLFEITGRLRMGDVLRCSVFVYTFSGDLAGSAATAMGSAVTTEGPTSAQVSMSNDIVGAGYTSLVCTLAANGKVSLTSISYMP